MKCVKSTMKLSKTVINCWKYIKAFGLFKGICVYVKIRLPSKKTYVKIVIPLSKTPIFVRVNSSDRHAFDQVFMAQECKLPVECKPKLIIDGGANVGYASVYYANKYPDAMIVAVEPDMGNFSMLQLNSQPYDNIRTIIGGLWSKCCHLRIINPADSAWAFRVQAGTSADGIKAITIDDILQESGFEAIDILKLDIEGAEKDVFLNNYGSWLSKVKVIVVELHDYIVPGCSAALEAATSAYGFKRVQNGEKLVLYKDFL